MIRSREEGSQDSLACKAQRDEVAVLPRVEASNCIVESVDLLQPPQRSGKVKGRAVGMG